MQAVGGFPLDIVIFGVIAVLLVVRLRSILGRRDGFEQTNPPPRPLERGAIPAAPMPSAPAAPVPGLPQAGSPLDATLRAIRLAEPGFDAAAFLTGAQGAFRIIVTAFAQGDLNILGQYAAQQPYATFTAAIANRQREGLTQHTEILGTPDAEILSATISGRQASITVKFSSEQISYTTNAAGEITSGHDGRTIIDDAWTFERTLGTPDPTWKLVATHPL